MLKRLRIATLLYVLLFVAAAEFVAGRNATDWDSPLWVDIYAVAGDGHPDTHRYASSLAPTEFAEWVRRTGGFAAVHEVGTAADGRPIY